VPESRLRVATVAQLAGVAHVPPDWLAGAETSGPIRWTPGTRLAIEGPGRSAWVAASRAYLSDVDEAGRIAVPTSTGLACAPDPWRALRGALLEVVERDAVMLTWLTRGPVTPVESALRWRDERGRELRFDRAIERYSTYLLDSPLGIPVVFAVARGERGQPGAAVGAAAAPDLVAACRKALVEAAQTFRWAVHMAAQGRAPTPAAGPFDDLDAHVAYYLDPDRGRAFDFLDTNSRGPLTVDLDAPTSPARAEQVCRSLVARAADADLECFAVDVTSPDVRAAGLWVIRAVIPGLYPLVVGSARPDHPRLPADARINPDPHPFP
jgi:ribosomal protein S12 methylthiotransferase accessory factor